MTAIDILDEMIGEYGFGGEGHCVLLALQEAKSHIQALGDGHTHCIYPIPDQSPDEGGQGNDLRIGDRVRKSTGYRFPGTVVAVYHTVGLDARYVVEMEYFGLQHIFNRTQLSRATEEDIYLDIARALPVEYLNPNINLIEKL